MTLCFVSGSLRVVRRWSEDRNGRSSTWVASKKYVPVAISTDLLLLYFSLSPCCVLSLTPTLLTGVVPARGPSVPTHSSRPYVRETYKALRPTGTRPVDSSQEPLHQGRLRSRRWRKKQRLTRRLLNPLGSPVRDPDVGRLRREGEPVRVLKRGGSAPTQVLGQWSTGGDQKTRDSPELDTRICRGPVSVCFERYIDPYLTCRDSFRGPPVPWVAVPPTDTSGVSTRSEETPGRDPREEGDTGGVPTGVGAGPRG